MGAQAFFYNAIFFTYALVLTNFYQVPSYQVGWYILPFALGNVLGPLVLGPLFDSIGRRLMIAFTYAVSGFLLAGSGWLFHIILSTRVSNRSSVLPFSFLHLPRLGPQSGTAVGG